MMKFKLKGVEVQADEPVVGELDRLEEENSALKAKIEELKIEIEEWEIAGKIKDDRAERLNNTLSEYAGMANVALSFVDLMPEHRLYESIRQDLKSYLNKLRK